MVQFLLSCSRNFSIIQNRKIYTFYIRVRHRLEPDQPSAHTCPPFTYLFIYLFIFGSFKNASSRSHYIASKQSIILRFAFSLLSTNESRLIKSPASLSLSLYVCPTLITFEPTDRFS
jgi:hypothetical protein